MIQLLLHESDPRNQPKMTEFWTPVGRWGDHFLSGRLSTRKGGVLLHFNHIATVSTRWRAQNLFESLTFTSRYMHRLPQRYIKSNDFEQRLESPRPYPQHEGMEQKNES